MNRIFIYKILFLIIIMDKIMYYIDIIPKSRLNIFNINIIDLI